MDEKIRSTIIRLISIAILAILVSTITFFQAAGLGIIVKSNPEKKIDNYGIYDVTNIKKEVNPDLSIQNNYGVKFSVNGSNTTINVLEIDIEGLKGLKGVKNYDARVFYSTDGEFIAANSVETTIRKGKNFITLNQIGVKEIYLDLFMDDTKIESIIINPDYSFAELLKELWLTLIVNFTVLFFCFFGWDKQTFIKLKKVSPAACLITLIMLYYYNKFSMLLHKDLGSYVQGLLFLLIIILGIKFTRMILDKGAGVSDDL